MQSITLEEKKSVAYEIPLKPGSFSLIINYKGTF